jgi:hypothetical protein
VFENRMLRRIFGSKRGEIIGRWRNLNDEINDLYSSPNIIRMIKHSSPNIIRMIKPWKIRWGDHVARARRS